MNSLKKLLLVSLLTLSLSACGGLPSLNAENSNSEIIEAKQYANVGTGGRFIAIQSSNVLRAGYDDLSAVMTIQFNNGTIYEYYDVPSELWISFVAAQPNPWSQVGYPRLVQGGYSYNRIN